MECPRCIDTPTWHSFDSVGVTKEGYEICYTFPAKNTQSVRTREDMFYYVSHFPKEKPWVLLFHSKGYTFSKMMPIKIAIEMGKLVQDLYPNLQKIYIIQGDWFMRFCVACIFPFLNKQMKEKFVVLSGSPLEISTELVTLGLPLSSLQKLKENAYHS